MEERVKVSIRFLKSKMEEYDLLRSHICVVMRWITMV